MKKFQLIKTYKINDNILCYRKITKPVISTIKIFIDNVETNNFDIDLTTGIITFNSAPKNNSKIQADFEFDVPVRFNNDVMEITMNSINSGNVKELELIEI